MRATTEPLRSESRFRAPTRRARGCTGRSPGLTSPRNLFLLATQGLFELIIAKPEPGADLVIQHFLQYTIVFRVEKPH